MEYQGATIGKYDLEFDGVNFTLLSKQTNCLAADKCGIPPTKLKVNLADLNASKTVCKPGGDCC